MSQGSEMAGDRQHNALDDTMANAEILLKIKEDGLEIRFGSAAEGH